MLVSILVIINRHSDEYLAETVNANIVDSLYLYLFDCRTSIFSEYIIGFNGYYSVKARHGYITAALDEAGVKSWRILPRDNALSKYPSDFDVIRVSSHAFYVVSVPIGNLLSAIEHTSFWIFWSPLHRRSIKTS